MPASVGFDNPTGDKSKDDLDRWRFALDIAEVIRSTPQDWSVRIGLFGGWGAGKSTILRYLADVLHERGSLVVEFNPSLNSSFPGVISSFGEKLIEQLERNGLYVEPKVKKLARKIPWLGSGTALSAVEATSEWFKAAKLASVGLGAVSLWLKPSGEQIKKICEKLPTQRIVVLIDDLDRTSADLLPKFLLSLREILDLPRFAFVLAFDDAIIADALRRQSPEWDRGEDFLEKILDFRFSLPPITNAGRQRLLARALRENAGFVPLDSVKTVEDLIPANPRKLKALVRGFRSIRTTIERHNPGEFSWTDLWLVQLLQQESHVVLQRLGEDKTFNDVVGIGFRLHSSGSNRKSKGEIADERTTKLLEGVELSARSQSRIKALLEAMRSRASMGLQYALGWFLRPPALTWKEFDQLIAAWNGVRTSSALDVALRDHAAQREDSDERVQQEFVDALSSRMDELLDKASRSDVALDRITLFEKASSLRHVISNFFETPEMINADRFMTFYKKAQYWVGVRADDRERSLRAAELDGLVSLAGRLNDSDAILVFEGLRPWASGRVLLPGEDSTVRSELRDKVASVIRPRVETQLLAFLNSADGFRKLSEPGKYVGFKALLFNEMPITDSPPRQGLLEIFKNAVQDGTVLRNVESFEDLLVSALNYRAGEVGRGEVEVFIKDDELLGQYWGAVRSRELLPRRILWLLGIRAKFIEMGASAEVMCLDKQLQTQAEQFEISRDEIMRSLWSN